MSSLAVFAAACDDDPKEENLCGNEVLDSGEACDGNLLPASATCANLVPTLPLGEVTCNADCTINTDDCHVNECQDGEMAGTEECDGTDFGGETCESLGFASGDLACTAGCMLDTSGCVEACNNDIWDDCSTTGGSNECCGSNGFDGVCDQIYEICLQSCDMGTDCGWSLQCLDNSYMSGECFYQFCGHGDMSGFIGVPSDINASCDLGNGREGFCVPMWRSIDDTGLCIEVGTLANNASCVSDDDEALDGMLNVDAATQCEGRCLTPRDDNGNQTSTTGNCFDYCDPNDSLAGTDTCPANWNCLGLNSIDTEPTNDDGSANSNFLFREADQGLCVPMTDGANAIIDEAIIMCDLVTGYQVKDGSSECPSGQTCQVNGWGSLLGVCADSTEAVAVDATCDSEATTETCEAGSICYIRNFMDLDMYTAITTGADPGTLEWACIQVCDASDPGTACDGIGDGTYTCVSASRIFTEDHAVRTYSYVANGQTYTDTETSESDLGFCVPPAATK